MVFPNQPMTSEQGFQVLKEAIQDILVRLNKLEKGQTFDADFALKLTKIKGIGKETIKDILELFPNEQSLKDTIKSKERLPFRNDISSLLIKNFK